MNSQYFYRVGLMVGGFGQPIGYVLHPSTWMYLRSGREGVFFSLVEDSWDAQMTVQEGLVSLSPLVYPLEELAVTCVEELWQTVFHF